MAHLASVGSEDMAVRNKAVDLCAGLLQKDYESEAKRCYDYCRDNIRYIRDMRGVELLHHAKIILQVKAGDCDDKCILLAALLTSIGHPCRFVAMAQQPNRFSHVWVQDNVYGKWVDLEATEPVQFGERVPAKGIFEYLYQEV